MSEDKVFEQLTQIRLAVARIEENQRAQKSQCDEHHQTLYGHNGEVGLGVDVDRLKQVEIRRNIWYGATVFVVIERVWSYIFHRGL